MLKVEKLESGYSKFFKVLHSISFEVRKGCMVCLLGPNGAGKSTTLKTIAGLLKPFGGLIEFEGNNIAGMKPYEILKLGISLIPEGRRVFGDMTVFENLQVGAYLKQSKMKFNDMLERVYSLFPILKARRNQKASTLSGGEQSMLVIARSLMSNPKLLMADELSMGLAPKLAQELLNSLRRLQQEEELTILLVEQNMNLIKKVMDYGYVLSGGIIVAEGTYEDLAKNPELKKAYLGM